MNKSNLNLEIQQEINSRNMAWKIAEAADDRKAEDIVLLNVEGISYITDYFVIATGFSKAQLRAISDSIEEKMERQFQKHPIRIEGQSDANWILHDYGDVIVHIFLPNEREFYDLEAFWAGAEKITFLNS
jgi:ribosome-associated protein